MGREEIFAGGDFALDQPTYAEHKSEINGKDEIVDRG